MWARETDFKDRLELAVTKPSRAGLSELSDIAVADQKWCYKHVSALLHRAYGKAKRKSKVHVLYAISAVVRKSKSKLGVKDQYADRLEPLLLDISDTLSELESKQQEQVQRLVQTWEREDIFPGDLIATLLAMLTIPGDATSQPLPSPDPTPLEVETSTLQDPLGMPQQQSDKAAAKVSTPQQPGWPTTSSHGAASTSTALPKPQASGGQANRLAAPTVSSASSKPASSLHVDALYDPFRDGDSPTSLPTASPAALPPPPVLPPAPSAAAAASAPTELPPSKRPRASRWASPVQTERLPPPELTPLQSPPAANIRQADGNATEQAAELASSLPPSVAVWPAEQVHGHAQASQPASNAADQPWQSKPVPELAGNTAHQPWAGAQVPQPASESASQQWGGGFPLPPPQPPPQHLYHYPVDHMYAGSMLYHHDWSVQWQQPPAIPGPRPPPAPPKGPPPPAPPKGPPPQHLHGLLEAKSVGGQRVLPPAPPPKPPTSA